MSAMRVARRAGSDSAAVEELRAIYDRFTEGFDTFDAGAARELLGRASVPRPWRRLEKLAARHPFDTRRRMLVQ
jgi:hypothetical protein